MTQTHKISEFCLDLPPACSKGYCKLHAAPHNTDASQCSKATLTCCQKNTIMTQTHKISEFCEQHSYVGTSFSHETNNNDRFTAPHLERAQSTYKDIRICSFYHTHTRYKYTRYWWRVGRMRRKKNDRSVCRREEVGLHFWVKRRKWRWMPDRDRKRVPDHRSNVMKGSLPQGPPVHPRNTASPSIRGWYDTAVLCRQKISSTADYKVPSFHLSRILESIFLTAQSPTKDATTEDWQLRWLTFKGFVT